MTSPTSSGGNPSTNIVAGKVIIDVSDISRAGQVATQGVKVIVEKLQFLGNEADKTAPKTVAATKQIAVGVGAASAEIEKSAGKVGANASKLGTNLNKIADEFDKSSRRIRLSAEMMGNRLTQFGQSMAGIGLGSAGIAVIGLRTADSLKATDIRFNAILKSSEKVRAVMAAIKEQAIAFGLPVNQAVQQFGGLLTYLKGGTEEMKRLISVTSRLTILDPQQGFEGATFALREAFSGSLTSLAARFEISKEKLRELMAQNGGDLIKALDTIVSQMGITEEAAKQMSGTFTNQFKALADEASVTFGNMFGPFFNQLTPAVRSFNDFLKKLNETNPAILQIIGGVLAITAAVTALSLVAGNVLTSFVTLKKVILSTAPGVAGLSGKIGTVVKGGIAATLGVGAGIQVAKTFNIGNINENAKRLNKSPDELAIDMLKMAFIKLTAEIMIFIDILASLPQRIENFTKGRGFRSNGEVEADRQASAIASKRLQIERLRDVPNEVVQERADRELGFEDFKMQLAKGGADAANASQEFNKVMQTAVEKMVIGGMFGDDPIAKEVVSRANKRGVALSGDNYDVSAVYNILREVLAESKLKELPAEIAALEASIKASEEAMKNGGSRADQIRRDADALIESILLSNLNKQDNPESAAATTTNDTKASIPQQELDAFRQFQDDLAQIERQAADDRIKIQQDFASASADQEAKHQRDLARANHDFERESAQRAKDHQKDMLRMEREERQRRLDAARQLERQIAERQAKANEDRDKIIADGEQKIAEINQDAQREAARRQADHLRDLQKMEDEHRLRLLDAAANLNAQAVANEQRNYSQQRGEKERGFNEEHARQNEDNARRIEQERQNAQQRLIENQTNLARELDQMRQNHLIQEQERTAQYERQRTDAQMRFDEETIKRQEQQQLRIADMNEQFALEQQKRREELQQRLEESAAQEAITKKKREEQFNIELAELGNAEARKLIALQNSHRNIEIAYAAHIARVQGTVNLLGGVQSVFQGVGNAIANAINAIRNAAQGTGIPRTGRPQMTAYALGTNRVPVTGTYQLHQDEVVLSRGAASAMRAVLGDNFNQAQATDYFMRGGGGGVTINGGFTPQINISNAGNYTPDQLANLIKRGTADALVEYVNEYLAGS